MSHDDEDPEQLENLHFQSVISTFQQYRAYSLSANSRRLRDYYALPLEHQALLDGLGWRKKIDLVDERVEANSRFLKAIVDYPEIFEGREGPMHEHAHDHDHDHGGHGHEHGHEHDHGHGNEHSHDHDAYRGHLVSHPDQDTSELAEAGVSHNNDFPIVEDSEDSPPGLKEPHPYDSLHDAHIRGEHAHDHGGHGHDHGHHGGHDHGHGGHDHGHDHGQDHAHDHGHSRSRRGGRKQNPKPRVSDSDMDKLRSTLKQFVRDWSSEGKIERDACYVPILEALDAHFSGVPQEERSNLQVLVPGTGLARLPYEVIQRGYSCQGNEFSHFMLLSSYYILNRTTQIGEHTIYPYIHSFSNMRSSETVLKGFKVPDVLPSELPTGPAFSLVAGDFEEIYGKLAEDDEREPQQGQWDAVLTCFFIDTAKNIVNYLKIIYELLTPGGVWINLGPLLWHFENSGNPRDTSIELTLDEVKELAKSIGFDIHNERSIDATYVDIGDSMLSHVYHASFWTATKRSASAS